MGTRSVNSTDFANKTTYVVEELPDNDAVAYMFFEKNRRCCFWIPTFRSAPIGSGSGSSGQWERIRTTEMGDGWWVRGLSGFRKVKEWLEVVAGPRWKTFIRRSHGGVRGSRNAKFHCDMIDKENRRDRPSTRHPPAFAEC
ncbi:hypothetical protein MRB53_018751 [Persea americana]|uniref:Uncharacterized protein n=1 Tax=Persea americana TaxID=3435 RepID=A0ACC2M8D0_PERAE|nr:hypothetical protein MRB53_018751 [Persea americana]